MASRKKYLEQEAQLEMDACTLLGSTSAPLIIQQNGLVDEWPSYEHKRNKKGEIIGRGRDVPVRGQDVFSLATWNGGDRKGDEREPRNFLKSKSYKDSGIISLSEWENKLTNEYFDFLTNHFTDRYSNLDGDGKVWLRQVVRLAVKYHVMRNKVAGYINALKTGNMDEDYICSPFAVFCYQLLQVVKLSGSEAARAVNFIVKNRPEVETLAEQIKALEGDPEIAYRQDELNNLRMQFEAMKKADSDYRKQVIEDFFKVNYIKVAEVVHLIAKVAGVPEFQQLAAELSHDEEGDAA